MKYKIANVTEDEFNTIKKAEKFMKAETGKDFILIAWQKYK